MTPKQAEKSPYDPFDQSKVWLHHDYPLIPVGRFVLDKNPTNYFAEVEQIAFDVSHVIPGEFLLEMNRYLKIYVLQCYSKNKILGQRR